MARTIAHACARAHAHTHAHARACAHAHVRQTVRFKNELERNITIKLGYANAKVYKRCVAMWRGVGDGVRVGWVWGCWGWDTRSRVAGTLFRTLVFCLFQLLFTYQYVDVFVQVCTERVHVRVCTCVFV